MFQVNEIASFAELRTEIEAVLSSATFVRSQRMGRLLQYLCDKQLAGEGEKLKEYNIAVDVLGRPHSFDPAEDAIARVEVHRLRKKLREYYEGEGASHKVRIVIPSGSYMPAFVPVHDLLEELPTPQECVESRVL